MLRVFAPLLRSPYVAFVKRASGSAELKGLTVPERGRRLAAMYKALPPAEVDALRAEAAKMVIERQNAIAAGTIVPKGKKPKAKRAWSGRLSAFGVFLRESKDMPQLAGIGGKDRGKKLGEAWRSMSAEQKKVFVDKANATKPPQ
jgi:hypothetical protein